MDERQYNYGECTVNGKGCGSLFFFFSRDLYIYTLSRNTVIKQYYSYKNYYSSSLATVNDSHNKCNNVI